VIFCDFFKEIYPYSSIQCPYRTCTVQKMANRTCLAVPSRTQAAECVSLATSAQLTHPLTSVTMYLPTVHAQSLDLTGWVLSQKLPVGTTMLEVVDGELLPHRTPLEYAVYHLCAKPPAAPLLAAAAAGSTRLTMQFRGSYGRVPSAILVDSGAEDTSSARALSPNMRSVRASALAACTTRTLQRTL